MNQNSDADQILLARISDMKQSAQQGYSCRKTAFLDEHQRAIAHSCVKKNDGYNYRFFGGHEDATRTRLVVASDYIECEDEVFEICPVTFTYRKQDDLTHRDFLGSLMALGIKREAVGDIVVLDGKTVVFVSDKVLTLVLEITKVGRIGVLATKGIPTDFAVKQEFDEISGSVSSLRLDCVVAFACRLSREKASALIKGATVFLNHIEQLSISKNVSPGDVFSVRGYGKFMLTEEITQTKKGRYFIRINKFK